MERIIAGRFETKGIADAAAVLLTQYIDSADICIFHNNPAGQHDAPERGQDDGVDAGSEDAGKSAAGTAAAAGIAAGAVGALAGPVVALAAAGTGAYIASLHGAVNELGNDDDPSAPPEYRRGGIMLAVRLADPANEQRVVATLRAEGAADVEQADGQWEDGDWVDFDPFAPPQLVGNAVH